MNNRTGALLYQGEPAQGSLLKLLLLLLPTIFLIISVIFLSSGETAGGLVMMGDAFLIGLILWMILPRSYQVFEDRLRIVLGGPVAINIDFAQVKSIEVTNKSDLTVNFVTVITKNYVRIIKKRGMNIAITPEHSELFIDEANRALQRWNNPS